MQQTQLPDSNYARCTRSQPSPKRTASISLHKLYVCLVLCSVDLRNSGQRLQSVVEFGLTQLRATAIKPRVKSWMHSFSSTSHDITEVGAQYSAVHGTVQCTVKCTVKCTVQCTIQYWTMLGKPIVVVAHSVYSQLVV